MDSTVRVIFLGDTAGAVRSVSRLESSFGSLGRTAKLVTGAIGIGLVGALAGAAGAAISFDRSMRNVNSIAKLSEKQFQSLQKKVLALAGPTGQAPKVLADGLYDIVSSGFKANDAIKILSVSAKAATAGMTDTATASKAVVAILNAYHLSADKARNVSSLLFTEVNKGVNTFEELAQNIGDTAPLAAQLKIPFSDVSAGLALITLHGTSMAEASTQMSRVMADLLKPSKDLEKTLHGLGYENGQAAIQAHGFIPLIGQLSKAASGSAAKTADWFQNIRSLRGVLNLTGPNLKLFNKFADEMAASFRKGGADIAAFNEQSKSISVQWQKAKSALTAAAIPIGQLLFPAITKVVGGLGDIAGWINRISQIPGFEGKMKAIGASAEDAANRIRSALQEKLQQVNWSAVGVAVSNGIIAGLHQTARIAKELLDVIDRAMGQINWDQVARKAGPFIAAALASAIAAALDPGFWIHHWDLALAIGLTAFGGAVGRLGGKLVEPLVRLLGRFAGPAGEALVNGILRVAEKLPARLQGVFLGAVLGAGRILGRLVGLAGDVIDRVYSAIAGRAGKIPGLLRFTLKVLGIDAAIHAIEQFATTAWNKISSAVNNIITKIKSIAGSVPLGFVLGPINAFVGIINAAISAVKRLISAIKSIPTPHIPSIPGVGTAKKVIGAVSGLIPGHAAGGFVAGSQGSPQLVLAHAGEVILNPMQQAALGGASFFKQTFGFHGEGPSFATGGIVAKGFKPKRRHPGKSPHHTRRPRYKGRSIEARHALAAVEGVNQAEEDTDRAYGQLVRQFDITQEQFIRSRIVPDPQNPGGTISEDYVSQPDIDQRVSEIDQLVARREQMLVLLDDERDKLKEAIEALKRAVAALVAAIKKENEAAAAEAQTIYELEQKISAERRKKKKRSKDAKGHIVETGGPDQRMIDRWSKEIDAHRVYQGRHQDKSKALKSTADSFEADIADQRQNLLHSLPFDRRDVELDVATLRAERVDVAGSALPPTTTSPPAASGGVGGGDGGGTAPPDVSELLRQIGTLKLALGIQSVQSGIIGSFQRGSIHVPATGLALLHAGEQVIPAGTSRDTNGPSLPDIHLHVIVEDGAVDKNKIRAEAIAAAPEIGAYIGRVATERARGGRY